MHLAQVAGSSSLSLGCEVEVTGTGAGLGPLWRPDAFTPRQQGLGTACPRPRAKESLWTYRGKRHADLLFQLQFQEPPHQAA